MKWTKKEFIAIIGFLTCLNCYGIDCNNKNFFGISKIEERYYICNEEKLNFENMEKYEFDEKGEQKIYDCSCACDGGEEEAQRIEILYNSKREAVRTLYFNDENLYQTVKKVSKYDIKSGRKKEIEIYSYHNNGRKEYESDGSIEKIYNSKNQLIKEGNYLGYSRETYYKYNVEGNLIEKIYTGVGENTTIVYYKYNGNLLIQEEQYEYEIEFWDENEDEFPELSLTESKKLISVIKYEYSYNENGILTYEKFSPIIEEYEEKKDIKNTVLQLEKSGIKYILEKQPVYFNSTQYISLISSYAYLLSEIDRGKEAAEILEHLISIDPNRTDIYLSLGDCYRKEYKNTGKEEYLGKTAENYRKYIQLLKKDTQIPDRVKESISSQELIYGYIVDNNLDEVKKIDINSYDINKIYEDNCSLLDIAVKNENIDMVKYILENPKIEPKTMGESYLLSENLEITKLLLQNGADINYKTNVNALINLYLKKSYYNEEEIYTLIEYLLKKGADINLQDEYGNTLLFYAAAEDIGKIEELILKSGADPDLKNKKGDTSVLNLFSVGCFSTETAERLLEKGASPYAVNKEGKNIFEMTETEEEKRMVLRYMKDYSSFQKIINLNKTDYKLAIKKLEENRIKNLIK